MTAKQLAQKLLKHPDDIVCVTSSNFEQGHNLKAAHGARRFKGKVQKEQFRDAFDGETYSSEIIRTGGDTTFVEITSL